MEFYYEKGRDIPIKYNVDVLVVGSGPAGIGAAISAARNGAKTMIIEQQGNPGGISTTGMMSHWSGDTTSKIYKEILDRSVAMNDPGFYNEDSPTINPEKLKLLYFEMLEEAGVRMQMYTFASDVIVENNKVKGVIVESKSGREVIMANVVIDASGDGDVAAKAGAEYHMGRESDGKMQPATLMFKVGGVDTDRAVFPGSFETTAETEKGEIQALGREHLEAPAGHVLLYRSTLPGVVTCNMTNCIDVDGTKVEDLTRAEIVCRRQMYKIEKFLREYAPGFENCYIISSASLIGIRETRHFVGEYTVTEEDILEARCFDDWILKEARFAFDIHNTVGSGLDANGVIKKFPQKKGYTIPYRALVPKKIDGLLLAGRNISGTHVAHSSFRVMAICVAMGEAAGLAAAISCKDNCNVRDVDVKKIQSKL